MSFDAWMKMVDKEVRVATGLSTEDLPDVCYRDWFEDGVTAKRAAKRVLRNAEFF